ncbi:hypothetical protein FRB99_000711 [Tulasnella sp. 403]|nr:hypothetical protein FRB99_000711 [Tulasnella sp. 403]
MSQKSDSNAASPPPQPTASSSPLDDGVVQSPPPFAGSQTPPRSRLIDIDDLPDDPSRVSLDAIVGKGELTELDPLLPPPEFSTYDADYTVTNGNIVSHDPHLNKDGEALYRFLLSHASTQPTFALRCHSSHEEWRTRQVSRYEDGRTVSSTETYTETVVDFDFTIDLSRYILPEPNGAPIWLVGDKDVSYRGRRHREIDSSPTVVVDNDPSTQRDLEAQPGALPCTSKRSWRRTATKLEKKASESWQSRREQYGFAPWVLIRGQIPGMEASVETVEARNRLEYSTNTAPEHADRYTDSSISAPTLSLRAWADEYCASPRLLKEFTFDKVVYGWNFSALRQAIDTAIRTNYVHSDKQPSIEFSVGANIITVKPSNTFSRMLSNKWILFLLWITLIYPLFIWPFKRFGPRGGGTWRIAGSAFALTRWERLEDSVPGESVDQYNERHPSSSTTAPDKRLLKATPKGVSKLVGTREGEWFAQWEDTIASCVRQRHVSPVPINQPMGTFATAGIGLDGYYPPALVNPIA